MNAFAFIEYMIPEGATAAIGASPRIYGNARLRVERKESTDPSARFDTSLTLGGSPRSPYFGESHDQMAMLYQRGLYAGFNQAAQAQAMPPPVWAGFSYYQPFDPSQYSHFTSPSPMPNDNNNNGTALANLQSHSTGYTPHPISQLQYPHNSAHSVQYPQQQAQASYQWPPAGSTTEDVHALPSTSVQGTQ